MNKPTYLLIVLLIFTNFSFAQDDDELKDKLFDDIALGTCECLNRKNLDFSTMEQGVVEMEFVFCVLAGSIFCLRVIPLAASSGV